MKLVKACQQVKWLTLYVKTKATDKQTNKTIKQATNNNHAIYVK